MPNYLIDTDTLTLYFQKHPHVVSNMIRHFTEAHLSIITIDEMIQGWQKVIRQAKTTADLSKCYFRYTETIRALQPLQVMTLEENAINRLQQLKKMKLNVGTNDLRLAATALDNRMTVVTRNVRDFARVPQLVLEDWSKAST